MRKNLLVKMSNQKIEVGRDIPLLVSALQMGENNFFLEIRISLVYMTKPWERQRQIIGTRN